nr:MAG TPA: antilipopolysaccharide factor, Lipid A binding protein [Caudoviricetes sp.]
MERYQKQSGCRGAFLHFDSSGTRGSKPDCPLINSLLLTGTAGKRKEVHIMNKTINDIMEQYKAGKITVEEANAKLKEAGANFSLDPNKNPGGGWTKEEMEQGFTPATGEHVVYPDKPDLSRRKELAGQVVEQKTNAGRFDVTYDELGYAVKATRK